VDQAHFLHVFVAGVAPVGEGGQGVAGVGGGTPVATPALAKGFVAHAFDDVAPAISDGVYAAEVVPT